MNIYATVTICGWPTLGSDSRWKELLLELNLNNVKRYFWEVCIKMPHFYCSHRYIYLLYSINLILDINKSYFEKWKTKSMKEETHFCVRLFLRAFNENATFLWAKTMHVEDTVKIRGSTTLASYSSREGMLLEVNLSHIMRHFLEVLIKSLVSFVLLDSLACYIELIKSWYFQNQIVKKTNTQKMKKQTDFCVRLFLRAFNKNISFLWAKTMHTRATVTICGWPTLEGYSRGRGLLIEVSLSHIKRYFREDQTQNPRFYCYIKCICLLKSIKLNLDTNIITFLKMKHGKDEKGEKILHLIIFEKF